MRLVRTVQMSGVVAILLAGFCHAQDPIPIPVEIPVQHPDDSSVLSGKMPAQPLVATIPVGSAVQVTMVNAVSSGSNKNGDTIRGVLSAPLTTSKGRVLPRGSKVVATVVSAAKAGTMQSAGVLSLQLTRVDSLAVVSDVVDFAGKEGHKDVADSDPEKGSEAKVQVGAAVTFHVMENGPATGLDVAGAAAARREGTVGGGGLDKPGANTPPAGPQAPAGSANTSPGLGQSPAKGAIPPPH